MKLTVGELQSAAAQGRFLSILVPPQEAWGDNELSRTAEKLARMGHRVLFCAPGGDTIGHRSVTRPLRKVDEQGVSLPGDCSTFLLELNWYQAQLYLDPSEDRKIHFFMTWDTAIILVQDQTVHGPQLELWSADTDNQGRWSRLQSNKWAACEPVAAEE